MARTVIVDLGTGNLHSVYKAVAYISGESSVCITSRPSEIQSADYLILPGQGAIGAWINQMENNPGLKEAITRRLDAGPVLGVCLGLQALYHSSEENGGVTGLGILAGHVKHFSGHPAHREAAEGKDTLKIPHMGWNRVRQKAEHPLWHGINDEERFYFVHSYYVESGNAGQVYGECRYGNRFTAVAGHGNLFATQFHPEKSQQAGLRLIRNFLSWNGKS